MSRRVVFTVEYAEFPNDDLGGEDAGPDVGWYVCGDAGDGHFDLGPDYSGPGLPTVDAALAPIPKWARDRAMTYHDPFISVVVTGL